MTRKSGKPPRENPFLQKDRKQLLEELDSIQEMLGDAARDVDEDSVPVLTDEGEDSETPAQGGNESSGDARNQIPLLDPEGNNDPPESNNAANERLRRALTERANPFLSGAARAADEHAAERKAVADAAARPESQPATRPETPASRDLDDKEMRALVDEVLAAWLPKIERELRARLMEYLRGQ